MVGGLRRGFRSSSGRFQHPIDTRPADAERLGDSCLVCSLSPEIPKPIGRQLRVAHRVLNVAVPEPSLQRPGIVSLVGKLVATAMAQHVRMDREWHARRDKRSRARKSVRRAQARYPRCRRRRVSARRTHS
jgi:hypothetical protein